jgi:hypothetical protein
MVRTLVLMGCLATAAAFAPTPTHLQRFELRGTLIVSAVAGAANSLAPLQFALALLLKIMLTTLVWRMRMHMRCQLGRHRACTTAGTRSSSKAVAALRMAVPKR